MKIEKGRPQKYPNLDELILGGATIREIRDRLIGISPACISYHRKKFGMANKTAGRPKGARSLKTNNLTHIAISLSKTNNFSQIAKQLGVSRQCINQLLNPEKQRARSAVTWALKSRAIIRPEKCQDCGITCKPESHHTDYSKPLEVMWLCKKCHTKQHCPNPKYTH